MERNGLSYFSDADAGNPTLGGEVAAGSEALPGRGVRHFRSASLRAADPRRLYPSWGVAQTTLFGPKPLVVPASFLVVPSQHDEHDVRLLIID